MSHTQIYSHLDGERRILIRFILCPAFKHLCRLPCYGEQRPAPFALLDSCVSNGNGALPMGPFCKCEDLAAVFKGWVNGLGGSLNWLRSSPLYQVLVQERQHHNRQVHCDYRLRGALSSKTPCPEPREEFSLGIATKLQRIPEPPRFQVHPPLL